MPQPSPAAAWESSLTNPFGLYIHVPFCASKCGYCSFYSVSPSCEKKAEYVKRILEELKKWGGQTARPIDTLYIGGGTPSLLCGDELCKIISSVRENFHLLKDAEITLEINPGDDLPSFLPVAKKCGVNRLSIGVQSANDDELRLLGRRHTFSDAESAVRLARSLGFDNLSADIMIGLPNSNAETLRKSLAGILSLDTDHISAYILKLDEDCALYKRGTLLPDDDRVSDQYLMMCEAFEKAGFEHYEISNFAKSSKQSRHNNRYWLLNDYLGIGPAAHSFFEGKRFYFPADLEQFLVGCNPVSDGTGGDREEFIMLSLRLSRGLIFDEYKARYREEIESELIKKAKRFETAGLVICDDKHISLTDKGMLVSNAIIGEFI